MDQSVKFEMEKSFVGSMVRGIYDLQKMRIQSGNRVAINFKDKLKQTVDMSTMDPEKKDKYLNGILKRLLKDYSRITDAIVNEEYEAEEENGDVEYKMARTLIKKKEFKPEGLIDDYNELTLVDQYVRILGVEEESFKQLGGVLMNFPIYTEFLSKIDGVGPKISGVLISEINIYKATYVSSIWKYAGLDVISIGVYTDDKGKEIKIPHREYEELLTARESFDSPIIYKGYVVKEMHVTASKKNEALVEQTYINKDKEQDVRLSITFNPFLKSKLIGVLGPSFLKSTKTYIDGELTGTPKRLELAVKEGYKAKTHGKGAEAIVNFLKENGHQIHVERTKYGNAYYNYRNRLNNHPDHKDKSDLHKHNMAIRYAVKRFLVDLYIAWRNLEGLPVTDEYAVRKLGLNHGQGNM